MPTNASKCAARTTTCQLDVSICANTTSPWVSFKTPPNRKSAQLITWSTTCTALPRIETTESAAIGSACTKMLDNTVQDIVTLEMVLRLNVTTWLALPMSSGLCAATGLVSDKWAYCGFVIRVSVWVASANMVCHIWLLVSTRGHLIKASTVYCIVKMM